MVARWAARLAVLTALSAATFLPPVPAHSTDEEGGDGPEWNQWGGNAARTFGANVDPVRAAPRVLWEARTEGDDASDPVASGGVLFVTSSKGGKAFLQAFSLADGSPLGRQFLGDFAGRASLAVSRGMVLRTDVAGLKCYRFLGNGFGRSWTLEATASPPPAVDDGRVIYAPLERAAAADLVSGRTLPSPELRTSGPPVVFLQSGTRLAAGLRVLEDHGHGGYKATVTTSGIEGPHYSMMDIASLRSPAPLTLQRIPGGPGLDGGWFLGSASRCFRGEKQETYPSAVHPDESKEFAGGLCTIVGQATTWRGLAFGFGADRKLVAIAANGRQVVVVKDGELPKGAGPGPATRAREVAFFGNWAADLATGRVLWCLPDLDFSRRLYPLADRMLVRVGEGGSLTCWTDRTAGSPSDSTVASAGGSAAPRASAPPIPPAPTGRDGLLLADGRELEGAVDALPNGGFRVAPPGGAPPVTAPAGEILLAQAGGKVLHRGRDAAILARWRTHLHPVVHRALEECHAVFAKEDLLKECAGILEEAKRWGLPEERANALARSVQGRRENRFADRRREAVAPVVAKRRAGPRQNFLAAADWCGARGFRMAAACLLQDSTRLAPPDSEVWSRADSVLPTEFPWAGTTCGGVQWMEWAHEIVEADAGFVAPGDPVWDRLKGTPWAPSDEVLVLRTPHVIFRTRCLDAKVVGRCVRNAEWTVRCLTELLGARAVRPVKGDADRMDVRLHADEKGYRSERGAGGYPMPWSAGYFSPREGVSRFFVPGKGHADPLGRALFEVMAHELTHHFLEKRWTGGRESLPPGDDEEAMERMLRAPGYWCIEGVARFVEDQVVEMDRRGLRFDDPTVSSLDVASQAEAKEVLFPPAALLDAGKDDFFLLSDREMLRVTLRHTFATCGLSGLSLFYEQSGATVYFLVNERGPEGRQAFFEYLCAYYSGIERRPGWKALGFASAEEFDATFRAFLRGLR